MTTPAKPEGCTYYRTKQLTRILAPYYDAPLAAAGLKITQHSLLANIERHAPIRQADLAGKMAMDASTLSRNLRPLLKAGWVTQTAEDARSHRIALSAEGQRKLSESRQCWRAAQQAVNAQAGGDDIIALHALLERIAARLRATTGEAGAAA